jgi:hypothetical protein
MKRNPLIIYLHGFNSSPLSFKARQLGQFLDKINCAHCYRVPALAIAPALAIKKIQKLILKHLNQCDITLIGSSLGGYYATYLSEEYDLKAVHINPAIFPATLLEDYLGVNTNFYTNESYRLTHRHLEQLKDIETGPISKPENHLVFLQTADDTLDYRDAVNKFRHCEVHIEQGGSHGFEHFERIIPLIMTFSGMAEFADRAINK